MWYTTRYEGFDAPKGAAAVRTATGGAAFQGLTCGLLRTGFLAQVLATTGLFVSYYVYRGTSLFTYDLSATTEEQRATSGFRDCLVIFTFLHLLGALYLLFFQTILADDASWARGYRAGSKMLGTAAFFDVISTTIQFIIYVYMRAHYDKVWWLQFQSGGVEWLMHLLARFSHAFALLFYASGLFLLEVYHDQGTNDWHGVLNCFLFTTAGISEIVILAKTTDNSIPLIISWFASISALVWAMAFEQEINASSPLLTEPELTNEIETQVERFARASPYIS